PPSPCVDRTRSAPTSIPEEISTDAVTIDGDDTPSARRVATGRFRISPIRLLGARIDVDRRARRRAPKNVHDAESGALALGQPTILRVRGVEARRNVEAYA